MRNDVILRTENVKKYYSTEEGFISQLLGSNEKIRAVDGVDLTIRENEILGIVGESGCGKTTLGKTLIRLEDPTDGAVYFKGEDISDLRGDALTSYRSDLQMVFQDPSSSLNPRRTIGSILERPLKIHTDLDKQEREQRIHDVLERVNLDPNYINRYPHQFSGGQQQRVGIARALMVEPDFVVADEPTSALDVSVQSSILNLLQDLKDDIGLTMVFIAHDLSVVRHIADRVAVMYLGEIVEVGETEAVYQNPTHPYTRALLSAAPFPDPHVPHEPILLDGTVPSPSDKPTGCNFHPRCPANTTEVCRNACPELTAVDGSSVDDHRSACHLFDDSAAMAPLATHREATNERSESD